MAFVCLFFQYLKSLIQHLVAKNVADADAGFALAFDLLKVSLRFSSKYKLFQMQKIHFVLHIFWNDTNA